MRRIRQILLPFLVLFLCGCASRNPSSVGRVVPGAPQSVMAEFIGSTPGDPLTQQFLGGLPTNKPCHCIQWHLAFFTNQNDKVPATYHLTASYLVPTAANSNRSEDGPRVTSHGTWEMLKGSTARPESMVFRITSEKSHQSLSFLKINDSLVHLLNQNGRLMIGTAGWSYTLNRADQAEKPGDSALALNATSTSYQISSLATGAAVFAVFEGRTPCQGIARELKKPVDGGCIKSKWRLTFYQDPATSAPTTYKVEGSLCRESPREGTWRMTKGIRSNPNEIVYHLDPTQSQPALLLWKLDENILLFLDQNREPLVGHADFSYTLNRLVKE